MKKIHLVIDRKIESNNKFTTSHWRVYHRYSKLWFEEVGWELLKFGYLSPVKTKKKVKIVSHRSRLLDKDNLYGGAKATIDALKNHGLIKDDSPKWITLKITQEKVKRVDERTEIIVQ